VNLLVIKYGGSLLDDAAHQAEFLKEIAAVALREKVVLIHGGGKAISRAMETARLAPRFVDGLRYTDDETMDIVEQTLAGVNAGIVTALRAAGVSAEGFSGRWNHIMRAVPLADLGRVGAPEFVHKDFLRTAITRVRLPVFYPVAEDAAGASLNINADDFALALAAAIPAAALIFVTDTGGILDKAKRLIDRVSPADVERLIQDGTITGGMAVKARACVHALRQGVGRVDIVKNIASLMATDADPEGTRFFS